MWVLTGVILYGFGGATVAVSFTEYRVHRRSLDFIITAFDGCFFVIFRLLRVGWYGETGRL